MKIVKLGKETYDYKSYVGPKDLYTIIGLTQFSLLTFHGLQSNQKVLDVGCGSLRLGKYLMEFLQEGNYFAIDPNKWLVEEALKNEKIEKKDNIIYKEINDFNLKIFKKKFDWIIANSIFIHACIDQIKICMQQAYKTMNKDAEFFFNYIEGEDNKRKEWSYPSSITYKKRTLKKIAEKIGFIWEDINWFYPGKQKWIRLYKADMSLKEKEEEIV
jgi:cyclopropane fatty-acyl-phospholipid synthase-like methyltransferase